MSTPQIVTLFIELHISGAQSLKEKRRVLKSLKDRIRVHHNVSVAEVDEQDKWQKAILGICMIGNDKTHLDGAMQSVLRLVERAHDATVVRHELEFV